jgi:hypothetical protein
MYRLAVGDGVNRVVLLLRSANPPDTFSASGPFFELHHDPGAQPVA